MPLGRCPGKNVTRRDAHLTAVNGKDGYPMVTVARDERPLAVRREYDVSRAAPGAEVQSNA